MEDSLIKLILAEAQRRDSKLYLHVLMALTMGMRKSEILGLRKDEVDLLRSEINLDSARLKTRLSRQVPIPISHKVLGLLKDHYEKCSGIFLFPAITRNAYGRPINYNQPQGEISRHWHGIRESLKINYRFHDLRHTAITNMIQMGLTLSNVSKIVGASERTINRIYDHINSDVRKQFATLFNDRF